MKITPVIFSLFFLLSISLYAQEYDEKNVVAKGCEKIQDNLELKYCLNKKLAYAFSKKVNKRLVNELMPGVNKFNLQIKIKANKKSELIYLNSLNPVIKKEFQNTLNSFKITQPGLKEGRPVDVLFSLPLTIQSKSNATSAMHKMSKITDVNNYKGNEVIYPEIEAYCNKENKEENFQKLEKYMMNFFFNSVDLNQIKPILNPGMNFFEVKIDYNQNDELTKITALSSHVKLNTIFEKTIAEIFKESGFKSPNKDDKSYAGQMSFYIFYMKA